MYKLLSDAILRINAMPSDGWISQRKEGEGERGKENRDLQRRATRDITVFFITIGNADLIRYSPRIALLKRSNKYLITKLVPFLCFPSPPPLFLYCTRASIECAQVSQTSGLLDAEAVHDDSNRY